ncbi:four helix bundle protein [Carboxylicivirga linearis]|uniref:Four helix bundle protein n=1 Tax=Carboxylicivirga linearis TaxID=1628157 RepID=A0ABS5JUH2_9BACT|nr:four helix bundle protein [Carboxylicivirga linearis]MBS2098560.1 four helix bundle protein [Carboxylicivirga linearis]
MYTYSFEKLEIWQLSRKLVKEIYSVTSKFPESEKFGLTNQLRRAAVSISSNIAEGNGRNSKKDKARFIEIAYSSLLEVLNQLILSNDLDFITENVLSKFRIQINELSNKLNSFHKNLIG